jgi:hypothetical protein
VNRTLPILDWLQDSALQRRKKKAFIAFMIDAAKRFAEDLFKPLYDSETPCFHGGESLFADDGHGPGIHTEEGIAVLCEVFRSPDLHSRQATQAEYSASSAVG